MVIMLTSNITSQFSIAFNGIWYTVDTCWSDEPNPYLIPFGQRSRGETFVCYFFLFVYLFIFRKALALYSHIYLLISFKLDIIIETAKVYILIPVWITLTFKQSRGYVTNHKLTLPFPSNFSIDFDEIQCVASTCKLIEAHAKFVLHGLYLRKKTIFVTLLDTSLTLACVGTFVN